MDNEITFTWKDSYRRHWAVRGIAEHTYLWWFTAQSDGGESFRFSVEMCEDSLPSKKDVINGMIAGFTSVSLSLFTDETSCCENTQVGVIESEKNKAAKNLIPRFRRVLTNLLMDLNSNDLPEEWKTRQAYDLLVETDDYEITPYKRESKYE